MISLKSLCQKQHRILQSLDARPLSSPYSDVANWEWADAHENACITLGEQGLDREPTLDEIEAELDIIRERTPSRLS